MINKSVPVLITWDVDPDLWIPCEQRQWLLNTAMDLCHSQGIRATFFFTAQSADAYLSHQHRVDLCPASLLPPALGQCFPIGCADILGSGFEDKQHPDVFGPVGYQVVYDVFMSQGGPRHANQ